MLTDNEEIRAIEKSKAIENIVMTMLNFDISILEIEKHMEPFLGGSRYPSERFVETYLASDSYA